MSNLHKAIREAINGSNKWDEFVDYVWGITLDGIADSEVGSTDELGWFGLVKFDIQTEKNKLIDFGFPNVIGAIISQDSQGFKHMEVFDNENEMNDNWSEIENSYSKFDSKDEDEFVDDSDDIGLSDDDDRGIGPDKYPDYGK